MSEDSRTIDHMGWKELPRLSIQLINRSSLSSQSELIESTVERILKAEAHLWLSSSAFHLPGTYESDFPFFPATDEINHVIETHQTYWTSTKSGIDQSDCNCVAIPLIAQDVLIGVLQVERSIEQPFSQEDVDLLEALATSVAVSIQLTRQVAVKNWRFEQLALVRSVSFQIANVLDLDELARRVTRLILHTFQFYYVAIFTFEPDSLDLRFRASARAPVNPESTEIIPQGFSVRLGEGMVGIAAQTGQELVAPDVAQEPHFRFIDSLPETQSEISLPLKIENKVNGVLDVQSDLLDAFNDMDIMVLKALADNIALAIEGTRLYNTAKRRADQISTVIEISRAIISILDLEKLLNEVVTLIHRRYVYTFVHLFTVNLDRRNILFRAGAGARSEAMKSMAVSYNLDDDLGIIPWVARNGKTVMANDVSQDERYRPSLLSPAETSSELTLPLVYGGKVLGVLDIQSNQHNVFDPLDLPLFEAFAANVAVSLRNATLYRSEILGRQIADSLRDVAGLISSNVGLDQVLDAVLTELERNLPSDVACIWLSEQVSQNPENTGILHLSAVHGVEKEAVDQIRELDPQSDKWLSTVLNSELPTIRLENDSPGPLGRTLGYPPDYSSIATPLRAKGKLLGLLALAQESEGRYNIEARELTATFANYAAVAIENTRIYAAAQEQAWISNVLLQVTEATQSLKSVDDLLPAIVRLTPLLTGVKGCSIFLWDETYEGFLLKAEHGSSLSSQKYYHDHPIVAGKISAFDQLRASNAPVLITDPEVEILLPDLLASSNSPAIHVLLPLIGHGEIIGALLIEYDVLSISPGNNPDREEEQLAIVQGIAQQAAIAIENIHLIEARQEEAYVSAVLLQVAQAVVGSSNLADTLEQIVNIMPILVGIDVCLIFLWDLENRQFRPDFIYYTGPSEIEEQLRLCHFAPGEFPILDMIWQTDSSIIATLDKNSRSPLDWKNLSAPENDDDTYQILKQSEGLLMGFPLSVKGELYGVMLTEDASHAAGFREKRLEIITGIAQQASFAIQNDRLQKEMVGRERFEREIQLAREIQQTFLPASIPNLVGWDMDVRWRPARLVGGDFYDFFELPGNHLGLVIADVSDKGMPAALYMAVTRTLIRAVVPDFTSPSEVLEHVNDLLLKNSQDGLFITAFYAVLNLGNGEIVYASAGHNLPLLLRAQPKIVERFIRGGAALGATGESIHLSDQHLQIRPGDCLVLYTDGVTETFSPSGEIYGERRLRKTIESLSDAKASSMLEAIDQNLIEYLAGDPPGDDTTIMVIHRLANQNRITL